MEPLPDLASLSDDELKKLIDELEQEEKEVSYRRRLLHGKIDILRAELVGAAAEAARRSELDQRRRRHARRTILAGKGAAAGRRTPRRMSHIYCPECGFQNPEAANYCARCGALLVTDDAGGARR